jgi:hypothetical protein
MAANNSASERINGVRGAGIGELLADRPLILAAINRGVREALLRHAQAGNPVATWKDGKVVWIQPAEVLALLANEEARKGN